MMMTHKSNKVEENNSKLYISGCSMQNGHCQNNNNRNRSGSSSRAPNYSNNNNNNNNNIMLDKTKAILPSFLSFEPMAEYNLASKVIRQNVENHIPASESFNGKQADQKFHQNGVRKSETSLDTSKNIPKFFPFSNNGSQVKRPLMPPPQIALSQQSLSLTRTKVTKKKSLKVISKSVSSSKRTKFSCPECDLGLTFRSRVDLQHHQSALHTPVSCKFCNVTVSGFVKLRNHQQTAHPLKSSSSNQTVAKRDSSPGIKYQTIHICGQCDYKTNQASNLIRHRESLHSFYPCAFCDSNVEIILGKKQLSEHLRKQHSLKINLKTYFEEEKKIRSFSRKNFRSRPNLRCDHCGYGTSDGLNWIKHDCHTYKVENYVAQYSVDRTSAGSRQSSVGDDGDGMSERSSSPFLFNEKSDPNSFNFGDCDISSSSRFDSDSEISIVADTESGSGEEKLDQTQLDTVQVPDFSAINEFFEFRLYDIDSTSDMEKIWSEALDAVSQRSRGHGRDPKPVYSRGQELMRGGVRGGKGDLVLTLPIHDELEIWEM